MATFNRALAFAITSVLLQGISHVSAIDQGRNQENELSKSTKEDLDEQARLEARLIELEAQRLKRQKTLTAEGHTGWVRTVAFSPDGKHLFSGAEDKVVKIWLLEP